jgi:hypothetical protein
VRTSVKIPFGCRQSRGKEPDSMISSTRSPLMQARTANEALKAQERRVHLQRMKGELVDRAKAVAQVFRLARDERATPGSTGRQGWRR